MMEEMHEADIIFVIMQHRRVLVVNIQVAQSKPMAAPRAASTPAAETPKVVIASLEVEVLVEEEPLPVAEPEAAPVSVGVALVAA